jgi:hypothetical protein
VAHARRAAKAALTAPVVLLAFGKVYRHQIAINPAAHRRGIGGGDGA